MTTRFEISDDELMRILNNALNEPSFEQKQARKRAKLNAAMADFFNLPECGFIEA